MFANTYLVTEVSLVDSFGERMHTVGYIKPRKESCDDASSVDIRKAAGGRQNVRPRSRRRVKSIVDRTLPRTQRHRYVS